MTVVQINDMLSIGGQPDGQDIAGLGEAGFRRLIDLTVLSLRLADAPSDERLPDGVTIEAVVDGVTYERWRRTELRAGEILTSTTTWTFSSE